MYFWSNQSVESKRVTQYAGSWYESNPNKLKLNLERYLNFAKSGTTTAKRLVEQSESQDARSFVNEDILAIIVPHAGYVYSGQTAAYAYEACLSQQDSIKRIFLLGPSHHVAFRGAALPKSLAFETPLGDLELDEKTISELATYPLFSVRTDVHRVEHSLELQLPFLKKCFPSVKIVPIVIGQLAGEDEARLIGEILKGYISKGDLVVVSSDFTHFGPRYGYLPFHENITENIRNLDREAFNLISSLDLEGFLKFIENTGDTICGAYPCQVLLALLPKNSKGTLLAYTSSKDLSGEDEENSVSYLSIVFSGENYPEEPAASKSASETINLSEKEKSALLALAKLTVEEYVRYKKIPALDSIGIEITPSMQDCYGVFVTLKKKQNPENNSSQNTTLRGCIGSIFPVKSLYKSVQENAVSACSRDPRFNPVSVSELNDIIYDVNILTPPRRISTYKNIVIGRDGVILSKNGKQAVFLPSVALEFNWSLDEMLSQLCLKAGLSSNDWLEGAKFDIFQSLEIH